MTPTTRRTLSTYGIGGVMLVMGFFLMRTASLRESWLLLTLALGLVVTGMMRTFGGDLSMRHMR